MKSPGTPSEQLDGAQKQRSCREVRCGLGGVKAVGQKEWLLLVRCLADTLPCEPGCLIASEHRVALFSRNIVARERMSW